MDEKGRIPVILKSNKKEGFFVHKQTSFDGETFFVCLFGNKVLYLRLEDIEYNYKFNNK